MAGGALMLGSFFLFKGWSASQSEAGLDAFEAAKAAQATPDSSQRLPEAGAWLAGTTVRIPEANETVHSNDRLHSTALADIPDTSLWSAQRVAQYEEASGVAGDAPQAVLRIEHLDIHVPVYNGADELNLNRGVARIIGTSRVGEGGNLGIAGHRDSFFRPLKDIEVGDRLELETLTGTEEYRVSSIEIVDPTALHVLGPSETRTVTLVTCYPFYYVGNAPQRFIVKAEALNNQVNS